MIPGSGQRGWKCSCNCTHRASLSLEFWKFHADLQVCVVGCIALPCVIESVMYSLSLENIECFTHVACSSINGVEQDCFKRPAWRTWLLVKRVYKLLNKFFLLEIQGNFKVSTEASTVPGVNPEAANEDQVSNSSFCKLHLQTNPRGDCWGGGVCNPRFVRNSLNIKSGSDVKIYLFHLVSLHFLFQVYFPPAFFPLVVVLFFCAFFGFVLVKLLPLARNIFIFISLFHFFNHAVACSPVSLFRDNKTNNSNGT